jgi:hypothetical protein
MYHSDDMKRLVHEAGLETEAIYDGLGQGHSIMKLRIKNEEFATALNYEF